jgi:branched-chain amino acid transport system substrate-binding protein
MLFATAVSPTSAQQKEILVGVVTSTTGPIAAIGMQVVSGVLQAAQDVNDAGGINGAKVRVIVEDDRSQPTGSVNAFNKLASEKPAFIVGPTFTFFMSTLAPIIRRAQIPVFSSAFGDVITDPQVSAGWVFRTAITTSEVTAIVGDYIRKEVKPKSVAIMYTNDEFGKPSYKIFKQMFENDGIKIIAAETFNQGDKDVSAQVLKLKAGNPDILIVWNSAPPDMALILNQVRQLGMTTKLVTSSVSVTPAFVDLAKDGKEGIITCTPWLPGLTDASHKWGERMKRREPGIVFDYLAAENYDGAMIAFEALKKVPNLEPKSVRDAIASIRNYDGIIGRYSFNERGDGLHVVQMVQWEKGELKPLSVKSN